MKWYEWGFRSPAHIGLTGPREPPEDGEMNEMTLPSIHRIRNSSPSGLRSSTLPLGHDSIYEAMLKVNLEKVAVSIVHFIVSIPVLNTDTSIILQEQKMLAHYVPPCQWWINFIISTRTCLDQRMAYEHTNPTEFPWLGPQIMVHKSSMTASMYWLPRGLEERPWWATGYRLTAGAAYIRFFIFY